MSEHAEQGVGEGLWLSVTQLAARKGVRKSTISEKVTRLVEAGRLRTKPGPGRSKLVNVAEYDVAVGEVGDGARELGAETKAAIVGLAPIAPATAPATPSDTSRLRDEQTREKAYAADLKFIELERLRGSLLPVGDFDMVAEDAASRIADIVDGLMARDSELAAVAVKEGENGVRAVLKRIVRVQREAIVAAMKDMAATARNRAGQVAGSAPLQPQLQLDEATE